jgi:ketosteroid isomerase-like protein
MTLDNEQIVRKAYQIAEDKDLEGWVAAFTDDGTLRRGACFVVNGRH